MSDHKQIVANELSPEGPRRAAGRAYWDAHPEEHAYVAYLSKTQGVQRAVAYVEDLGEHERACARVRSRS